MAISVNSEDVYAIGLAVAKANRHPDPEWWASRVQAAFDGTEMPEAVAPTTDEPAPEA